jgi:UDPglucose--hexose-1-phosphate uridylyltransferase
MGDQRRDRWSGTAVHVVGSRQARPNLPADGCPFCVGGLEAPEPYETRWFPNRWPAMDAGRCEVILYSPGHITSLARMGARRVRPVVDLWAERTAAQFADEAVRTVLVFENRGCEVGATIDHPHGQLYAFDHVPERTARRWAGGWQPDPDPSRLVTRADGWASWVPHAPVFPASIEIAPLEPMGDLVEMGDADRDALASLLVDALVRLERLLGANVPYMMWINQRPRRGGHAYDGAWCHVELVSPWRSPGVARYIAAAEVATGEYFNPVVPEALAESLRAAL